MANPPEQTSAAVFDEGRVSYAIFELARAHRSLAASLLRKMNLHPGQELILMHLHRRDGQTQSELVESIGVDHSTMSKALRRMQETGLLTREPAEYDRRVQVNHLTPQGEAMREPIAAMWHTLEEATTSNLSSRQAASLLRTARTIVESINSRISAD
ncbi:winged helix-turn-helix transcriptional regulator [Rhodococcus fascians]|nr:winged helix-turn-helix transcriptional regulator [Rhodococcus fascians]MBY3999509.1 winged helix-turn-helix transcriptional regulator [Rhodococcus fascians]MBY4005042.1 winged helix-turn-helix transcriptional regulator [Rhodococcus fascians]MBY4010085.1 winged helix-turn-helix transcriptional regulator [Rhodococcus fascians]MBY4020249.1 winged helix-turn-helix transcriptional regulator [Rhodococcus fascians]